MCTRCSSSRFSSCSLWLSICVKASEIIHMPLALVFACAAWLAIFRRGKTLERTSATMATTPMSSIYKRIVTMPAMDAPAWRTMALCGTSSISRTPNSGTACAE